MFPQRSSRLGMYQADLESLDRVGRDGLYGQVARSRSRLFRDDGSAELCCPDNGRPAVPSSHLAVALLLQAHDKVSDQEATARANYDVRWCVALGIEIAIEPFVRSTLQLFRSQLLVREQAGAIFAASLEEAKRNGLLRGRKRTIALDTTPIFGKGAAQDTYNLLATGIVVLVRELAEAASQLPADWAADHELLRYFGSSIKGEAAIGWDKKAERDALLASIVGDALRLLQLAREALTETHPGDPAVEAIRKSGELLCQLLVQGTDGLETDEPHLKDGVSRDRMPSATDPEMRHGRKSRRNRFDGHKAALAMDTETGLVTDADVIAVVAELNRIELHIFEVVHTVARDEPRHFVDIPDNITAPPIGERYFRQYCMPLYQPLAAMMADVDAKVFCHMDGDLKPLWAAIGESGLQGIDSFSPPPDNDTSAAEALAQWPYMRLSMYFPSSIHIAAPEVTCDVTTDILQQAGSSGRLQIQISENVPPGPWRTSYPQIVRAIHDFASA